LTTEHWPLPGSFTTAVLSVTVLMDVVVVVLFAMTMLVVHALTDAATAHGSASSATVLGLFSAQARTGTRHARRTVHGARIACTRPAHRTACTACPREHGMPPTARTARRHAARRHAVRRHAVRRHAVRRHAAWLPLAYDGHTHPGTACDGATHCGVSHRARC